MKPQYIALVGTTPEVIGLNTNCVSFEVLVRCGAGITLEGTIDDPADSVGLSDAPAINPNAPVWTAIVLDAAGYANLTAGTGVTAAAGIAPGPWRALRFTPTAGGAATILQQGIR